MATAVLDPAIGAKRLVGYVTPGGLSAAAVRAHCAARLVPAMVPSAIVPLAAFPLLANGKIDVAGLPPLDWAALATTAEYVPPETPTQARLQEIWGEILGGSGEPVSVAADFLAVGGTSMLLIRMAGVIQARFDLGSPLNRLHELSTIQEMAAYVDETVASGGGAKLARRAWGGDGTDGNDGKDAGIRPASYGQEQMYLLAQFDATGYGYNEPLLLDLAGRVDVPRLEAALRGVMARQQLLRTCREAGAGPDGGLGIRILPDPVPVPLRVLDLRGRVPRDADAHATPAVHDALLAESQAPFDLAARAPLWRVLVVQLAGDRAAALVTMHHAIMDGWWVLVGGWWWFVVLWFCGFVA